MHNLKSAGGSIDEAELVIREIEGCMPPGGAMCASTRLHGSR